MDIMYTEAHGPFPTSHEVHTMFKIGSIWHMEIMYTEAHGTFPRSHELTACFNGLKIFRDLSQVP